MTQDGSLRRSVRKRVPSKKYSTDTFANPDNLDSSDEREERGASGPDHHQGINQRSVGRDFDVGVADDQDEDEEDEEYEYDEELDEDGDDDGDGEESGDEAENELSRQSPLIAPVDDEPDGQNSLRLLNLESQKSSGPKGGFWRWREEIDTTLRSRGFFGKVSKSNHDKLLIDYYGEDTFECLARSVDHYAANITFPCSECAPSEEIFAYPPGFVDGLATQPSEENRIFFEKRRLEPNSNTNAAQPVHEDQRESYLPGGSTGICVWLGPYDNQKRVQLDFAQCLRLDVHFDGIVNGQDLQRKRGWLFNVGGRVLSMSWAPAEKGSEQYLAVAVDQTPRDVESNKTPFVPSDRYRASIQIWRFRSPKSQGPADAAFAWDDQPQLIQVICTEWGTCRRLKWCPCSVEPSLSEKDTRRADIGLLASIWTDGYVRVLNVNIPCGSNEKFLHYEHTLLEARPPQSVCTCLEWLSSTDLATGCANGYVAIWRLKLNPEHLAPTLRNKPRYHRPYFYREFSETFIIDMASAAPISPHLLATLSVSGYQRLTDLRSPATEDVPFMRSRVYATSICYSPHVQNFYSSDDQGDVVQLVSRRFYSGKKVLSLPTSSSGGTLVASSPLHTSILIGTPDGKVECTNPVRKQMAGRQAICWSQKWFVHEWRRKEMFISEGYRVHDRRGENGVEVPEAAAPVDCGSEVLHAIVRISEGYKAEKLGSMERRNRSQQKPTVVYHDEQAITALEWNPNIDCGSWAAAGMGSGLVRVEDVAV